MRIVGYIEHPKYKITIMHMNLRYALKFEIGGIEQTYKIRQSDTINSPRDIENLVTEDIFERIDRQFAAMESIRHDILKLTPKEGDEDFEEII